MKLIWKIFLFFLNLLKWWFFNIPSRFSLLALVGNFLIIYWFQDGRPLYLLQRDLRGISDFAYCAFWICFGFPLFFSFFCCWTEAKMTSSKFRKNSTSALDNAIEFRNGQKGIQTAQEAFKTLKNTASLDQMKANEGNSAFDKSIQGFNALYGNKTPQEVYKGLTKDDC
jgi:hypothetical protein